MFAVSLTLIVARLLSEDADSASPEVLVVRGGSSASSGLRRLRAVDILADSQRGTVLDASTILIIEPVFLGIRTLTTAN